MNEPFPLNFDERNATGELIWSEDNMNVEIWKTVPSNTCYEVSNYGSVRRIGRKNLTPFLSRVNGYLRVSLSKNTVGRLRSVASLVAEAFIYPRPQGLEINHINGDKTDNRDVNLEYVTRLQNARHAIEVLGHKATGRRPGSKNIQKDKIKR